MFLFQNIKRDFSHNTHMSWGILQPSQNIYMGIKGCELGLGTMDSGLDIWTGDGNEMRKYNVFLIQNIERDFFHNTHFTTATTDSASSNI